MALLVPISWGELFDKITILQIKSARVTDLIKLANIHKELDILTATADKNRIDNPNLHLLVKRLKTVNESLWEIEDKIRCCENDKIFGQEFIELARLVYITNDKRAELKYQINQLLDSDLIEEKFYQQY